jgi:hypothetical protein
MACRPGADVKPGELVQEAIQAREAELLLAGTVCGACRWFTWQPLEADGPRNHPVCMKPYGQAAAIVDTFVDHQACIGFEPAWPDE